MAIDNRCKDGIYNVPLNSDGTYRPEIATLAVLMDIRDELKAINRILRRDGPKILKFPEGQETKTESEAAGGAEQD